MSRLGDFISRRPILSTVLAGSVLVAGVSAVSAQYGGGRDGWGHGGWGYGGGRGARLERFCAMPTARFQPVARAYVKADLNMTDPQKAEFDKLADVLAPAFEAIKADICGSFKADAPKLTPPEKLEKIALALRKAATAAENAVAPAKSLYSQLDDAQKAQIDQRMERRMGRGERRGEGRGWQGEHRMDGRGERGWGHWNERGERGERGWGRGPGGQGPSFGQTPDGPGGPFFRGGNQ